MSIHQTKDELLAEIERSWTTLSAALDRLAEAQMTTLQDAQGWTVKDHVSHLTSWERSAAFFLQGKPRHIGLEVDEALYLEGDEDKINATIQQRQKDLPLDEVLARFRQGHWQLVALLEPLSDEDLQKPYRHYLPDEPGTGGDRPAMNVIYSNTAHHFMEHLEWIEALVSGEHD